MLDYGGGALLQAPLCPPDAIARGGIIVTGQLAANVHDVWAKKRVEDGWRHGATRNDQLKTNPSLVPYDELPDSEKDYDRVMVEQVIRAAVALGYRIDALDSAGRAGGGRPAGHWLARLRGGFSNRETTQT
jgi:hypothetical protein